MIRYIRRSVVVAVAVLGASVALSALPALRQAAPALADRVTALKQSLQDSQLAIRKYEWVETTSISLKGEEKSRKQQRCYYGADGKLQKIAMGPAAPAPAPPAPSGGR